MLNSIIKHYLALALPSYLVALIIAMLKEDMGIVYGFGIGIILSVFHIIRLVSRVETVIVTSKDTKTTFIWSWDQVIYTTITWLTLYLAYKLWGTYAFIACAFALALVRLGILIWFQRKEGVK